jgi:adenylosuccinate synthase
MLIEAEPIGLIVNRVYGQDPPKPETFLRPNPIHRDESGIRSNSALIEDAAFGDSGKGRIADEINYRLLLASLTGRLWSEKYNGSDNSGHEITKNGIRISLHQLPVASIREGATAILGRGMLVHPVNLLTEIKYVEKKLGAKLPARLIIDANVTVSTDLHRAYEAFVNNFLDVGHGNTSSGVSMGYASYYEKRPITMRQLMSDNWKEIFTKQYQFYAALIGGEEVLAAAPVKELTLDGKKAERPVGNLQEFLDRLETARTELRPFVRDISDERIDIWQHHPEIPYSFESNQGPLLDPWFGVSPDYTASRPNGIVGISDSTEGKILHKQIALKVAVLKTPYMSSVGARKHPYAMDPEIAKQYRTDNDETGRSTGRDRGIYPIDLVAIRAAHAVAQYDYVAITHFDANYPNVPIELVTDYIEKATGKSVQFRPYQWHWDSVRGNIMKVPSWDGKKVAEIQTISELPEESLRLMSVIHQTIAPVYMVTKGRNLGETLFFTK